ncbi:unnamed protein product [Phytophthora fragariaefolia]|uniref:Unnamed protein product n=1 Tax=Phytophthora fragariaefolia TaxID=1490495 RepID=A0A9W7CYQ1_9STRA|nr:unnamed protein product [Phytophthora fragariaefolia]
MNQLLAVDSNAAYADIEIRCVASAKRSCGLTNFPLCCIFQTRRGLQQLGKEPRHPRESGIPLPAVDTTSELSGHRLEENSDIVDNELGLKKRQRTCKVCALNKTKPRKYTKYFYPECSIGN